MSKVLPRMLWNRRNQAILIIILIFLVGFVIVEQANRTPTIEEGLNSTSPVDNASLTGQLSFIVDKDCCEVGKTFKLGLKVDSGGTAINGFDAVILFDNSQFNFQSSQTDNDQFDIVTVSQSNGISVAGIIKATEAKPVVVEGTIVYLQFTAKTAGQGKFSFEFAPGRTDDSNIVNIGSTDILKTVEELNIKVKS